MTRSAGVLFFAWMFATRAVLAADHQVTVTAGDKPVEQAVLTAELPADLVGKSLDLVDAKGNSIGVQEDKLGGKPAFTFIASNIPAGQSETFTLKEGKSSATGGVEITKTEKGAEVKIDGKLFTIYQTNNGPKPYLWPIIGPTGALMTRSFPMEKVKGELRDHHHHRGMWFTFDKVNDNDFWSETPTSGKTIHNEFISTTSGPVFGEIVATVTWQPKKGDKIAEDVRTYRFYRVNDARLVDFAIDMKSVNGPLKFGDSKEGLFAIRVNEQMKVEKKENPGSIVNSNGDKDGAAWGKRAEWCDYFGDVDGQKVGIAIFDNTANFRHPTYWHVRTYGLFGANPFGLSHFTGDKNNNGAHEVKEGEKYSAKYRVYFHKGDTNAAHVADWYAAYAHPPKVTVK